MVEKMFYIMLFIFATLLIDVCFASQDQYKIEPKSFVVDWDNDRFLKDGEPFKFVSGELHYFRSKPQTWEQKLRTLHAAGLQVVSTYVQWSLHNPKDGVYTFDGIADLVYFLELANREGLLVLLRPGPYICAEIDMGGLPYWLLHKYPNIQLRTSDTDYLREVEKWYDQLMPKIEPFLYGNGGPIIMVQVENEYGAFRTNDVNYKNWLKELTERYVKDKAVLFTNDLTQQVNRGYIPGVLATLDLGTESNNTLQASINILRRYMPKGPVVIAEYYAGWLTHWQEDKSRVPTTRVINSLAYLLSQNASVNIYMFHGGTNFGFFAGANDNGPGFFASDITSYDYDAPMDEAGEVTSKYLAVRNLVGRFFPLPNIPIPQKAQKLRYPAIRMTTITVLIFLTARNQISTGVVRNRNPMSFEQLNQFSGFVLYETRLPRTKRDPGLLRINTLHDRAYVFVDRNFIGIMSRANAIDRLSVPTTLGFNLQILVENEGRINFNIPNDFKGILGAVTYNGQQLYDWTMTQFPLEDTAAIQSMIDFVYSRNGIYGNGAEYVRTGPTFFFANFNLRRDQILDTYLNPTGWGKGIVFINGFNLGRYWPLAGPQVTLYVPKEVLRVGRNNLTLLEFQKAGSTITFENTPILDQ